MLPTSTDTRETRNTAREIKFAVDPALAGRIRDWARDRIPPDPHGTGPFSDEYPTTSLYLDTVNLDVYHRRGSYGRSKYRIRRYGAADFVFLERKLRTGTLLSKRRTAVALDSLRHLTHKAADPSSPGVWFHRRMWLRGVAPTIQVSYHRIARVGEGAHGPIRLTLDDQVHALPAAGLAFRAGSGTSVVEGRVILELKFRVEMPALFRHLVEEFGLEPVAMSKYRLAVPKLGLSTEVPGGKPPTVVRVA